MTDKKFTEEFRKAVDIVELPGNYKDKILSDVEMRDKVFPLSSSGKKDSTKNYRRLVTAVVAAVLVIAVGLGVIFSIGINLTPTKEVRFYVASATNLNSVAGARIVFIDTRGDLLTDKKGEAITAVTDENGEAVATIPSTQEYTAQITVDGYIPLEESSDKGNFYISPVMNEDTYRAVLTWESECDLDAHLSVTIDDVTERLNYFNSDIEDSQGQVIAALDTDNEKGDGPETITFNAQDNMTFRFSVASYSALKEKDETLLAHTGAKVTLYRGEECVDTYSIDTSKQGNVWCVFEIENSQISLCDYTYSVSAVTEIK